MSDESEPTEPTLPAGVSPDELFARGMQSARMTGGAGAHGWEPPEIAEMARLFPGYEVLRLLGRGGMGAVYQARQISLDRLVAIKLLPLEISVDQAFADRFRREARAMAKLNHPNIISVHDFGQTAEGHLFIAMEYVEGANLADIIHKVGLNPDQALSVVEQICAALGYAHGKGIVHRDIKPANVMIDTESHVKVADFGLARLIDSAAPDLGHTMTGIVMGTPDYMAPEQTRGMNVDHRADIYSLGVMIYEMLCGQVPKGIFQPPSVRTGCDVRIDGIVIKAMQQEPEHRYQSTREMKADVQAARTPQPVPPPPTDPPKPKPQALAEPAGPLAPVPTPAAKGRMQFYVGIVAGVVALIGGTIIWTHRGGTRTGTSQTSQGDQGRAETRPSAEAPAAATKEAPFVNSLGMKFVPVPGTKVLFSIWDTRVKDYAEYALGNKLDGAWQTQEKDGIPLSRGPEYPVCGITWNDANAFCAWLTDKETATGKLPKGARYRLPTDEEWSRAVGLASEQGATPREKSEKNSVDFPWGIGFPPTGKVGNYADNAFHERFPGAGIEGYTDEFATTSPVGSFPANAYGLYDMGGNVWQWCEDWFDASQKHRVLRGGSWTHNDRSSLLSSSRYHNPASYRTNNYGFRCVLEPAPAALLNPATTGLPVTANVPVLGGTNATPAAYPQPRTWIDATDKVRSEGLKAGSLVADGDWLTLADVNRAHYTNPSGSFANVAFRVMFANKVSVYLRKERKDQGNTYWGQVSWNRAMIGFFDGATRQNTYLKWVRLEPPYVPDAPHELVFAAQGDKFSLWVDGKEVATVRDQKLQTGITTLELLADKEHPPRIKKVEYGELEAAGTGTDAATSPAPAAPK